MARPKTGLTKTEYASFRIAEETARQWEALANHHGISKTAVFEMLIRKGVRDEGIEIAPVAKEGQSHE